MSKDHRRSRPRSGPGPTRRPPAPGPARPQATQELRLPNALVRSWRDVVTSLLRLPPSPSDVAWAQRAVALADPELEALWQSYTQERRSISARMLATRNSVAAYVLGFHLVNATRARLVFERAARRWSLDAMLGSGPLHILDLGAGSGAASQVAALGLVSEQRSVHVDLFDQNRNLLQAAQDIFEGLGRAPIAVNAHRTLLHELRPRDGVALASTPGSALVILSFVWNELGRSQPAQRQVRAQLAALSSSPSPGLVLLLEPANQAPCRRAMELRDSLLELALTPLYPCPSGDACPMLERARDWCYSEARWLRPTAQQVIDRALGVDRDRLAVTGMLLANAAAMKRARSSAPAGPVVVGRPTLQGSTQVQYLLCLGRELETRAAGQGDLVERGQVLGAAPRAGVQG